MAMGFQMSAWDKKLLKYGGLFEQELMALSVNIPLERALDLCWDILARCFEKTEISIKASLIDQYWPT
jgi:V/A-type H+-transporting ATPase subunit B